MINPSWLAAHHGIEQFRVEELQNDARADLLERIKAQESENSTLRACIANDCENEELLKQEALKVLPEMQVNGDSLGVPSVAGIGENLVARIKALEGALKLALGAFEQLDCEPHSTTANSMISTAIEAIKACGVTL